MHTLANSEDSNEMLHTAAFHPGLHCSKRIFRENNTFLEIIACVPSMYTMNHPKLIVSYQVEEPIRIQWVRSTQIIFHAFSYKLTNCVKYCS